MVVAVGGCSSSSAADVNAASDRFLQAVANGDGARACQLLAPRTRSEVEQSAGKPCPQAILEEEISAPGAMSRVSVFGPDAQVRYQRGATFLSRFSGGWRVVAAGCTPAAGDRYDCSVEAG